MDFMPVLVPIIYFLYGPNTRRRSHFSKVRHKTYTIRDVPLSRLARRSFTQLQKSHQKLLFLYVNRSPIWYGFHASAKAIRYRVNITLEKGGEQVNKHDIEQIRIF